MSIGGHLLDDSTGKKLNDQGHQRPQRQVWAWKTWRVSVTGCTIPRQEEKY
jgi:hypothetical protein